MQENLVIRFMLTIQYSVETRFTVFAKNQILLKRAKRDEIKK